jgi:ATP-dependent exoDNAse (exonuclease V) alpha subunit
MNGKIPIGCENLNAVLSEILNPGHERVTSNGQRIDFVTGDKIVRTSNGVADELLWNGTSDSIPDEFRGEMGRPWLRLASQIGYQEEAVSTMVWRGEDFTLAEAPIVNGDMGTILDVCDGRKGLDVIVRFRNPDRLVRLPYGDSDLVLAYAITCHKAQGSGFPYTIVPIHSDINERLLVREWIYTAISRAENLLVTVGEWKALEAGIRRKTVHLRRTQLKDFVVTAFEGAKVRLRDLATVASAMEEYSA